LLLCCFGQGGERLWSEHPQSQIGAITVDFVDIERTHEGKYFTAHNLSRHQNREPRWVGNDEPCRDNLLPGIQCILKRAFKLQVITIGLFVTQVIGGPNIAFWRSVIRSERIVEPAEVRQRRIVFRQVPDPAVKRQPFHLGRIIQQFIQIIGDLDQHFDKIRHRGSCCTDVGHEQNRVARRLVDLDAKAIHQNLGLERIAVPSGSTNGQCHARGVEYKVVLFPAIPHIRPALFAVVITGHTALPVVFGDQVSGRQDFEILLQLRMAADGPAHRHGGFDLSLNKFETLQFDLTAPDIQRCNDLVVGRG
jgi:hypothetical protein